MKSGAIAILLFLFVLTAAVVFFQYAFRYVLNYRIAESDVKILFLGMVPIIKVQYEDIDVVKKIPFSEAMGIGMLMSLRLGNRLWGQIVLIRKKKGIIKNILITPDSPERFVRETMQKMHELRPQKDH